MSTLQDKTYRAMLRLEADKPDAISLLCRTLLTAWQAGSSVEKPEQFAEWLSKVTPICLGMLSTSTGSGNVQSPDPRLISCGRKEMRTNMEVKVVHVDQVRFSIHARNHIIISDQPAEGGGQDTGMTPPELLLASLGSCAAFYAVQYLKTRKLAEHGVEVTVTAEKLKLPARMGNFLIHVRCPVPLTEDQNQGMIRSIHQCLVHNTLVTNPQIAIELTTENPAINKV